MTSANGQSNSLGNGNLAELPAAAVNTPPLHRLSEVRRREGISQRTVARRLGIPIAEVAIQEHQSTDLPLSVLCKWQQVLNVPMIELLTEPGEASSPPLEKRGQLLRLMKTALSLLEVASKASVKRMAQTMVEQLVEMMPELREVTSWHAVGRRRRRDELGRVAEHPLPDDMFISHGE